MREHSRMELARKLAPHASGKEEVEALLDDLTVQGWLSEARAAQSVVRRRSERLGLARVKQELQVKGLPASVVAEAVAGLAETEQARAVEVWRRKFSQPPVDVAARAKQMRFLLGRGFSPGTVSAALKQVAAEFKVVALRSNNHAED